MPNELRKKLNKEVLNLINVRPQKISDYIGQSNLIKQLKIAIQASLIQNKPLPHILLFGPPGLGKTTLAQVIANETHVNIVYSNGSSLKKMKDLMNVLCSLKNNDVLFIDEIHRMPKTLEEVLYSAMEDYYIDIIVNKEITSDPVRINLKKFTLIGATTRIGDLSTPFKERFSFLGKIEYYSVYDLMLIIKRTTKLYKMYINDDNAINIALRSRGTPRIANNLVKRIIDYCVIRNKKELTIDIINEAFKDMGINEYGLDLSDKQYIRTLMDIYLGGPIGLEALASTLEMDCEAISNYIEPYLLKLGLITRTKKGRIATPKLYKLFEEIKNES